MTIPKINPNFSAYRAGRVSTARPYNYVHRLGASHGSTGLPVDTFTSHTLGISGGITDAWTNRMARSPLVAAAVARDALASNNSPAFLTAGGSAIGEGKTGRAVKKEAAVLAGGKDFLTQWVGNRRLKHLINNGDVEGLSNFYMQRAFKAREAGQHAEAARCFEHAIDNACHDNLFYVEMLTNAAVSWAAAGKFQESAESYRMAREAFETLTGVEDREVRLEEMLALERGAYDKMNVGSHRLFKGLADAYGDLISIYREEGNDDKVVEILVRQGEAYELAYDAYGATFRSLNIPLPIDPAIYSTIDGAFKSYYLASVYKPFSYDEALDIKVKGVADSTSSALHNDHYATGAIRELAEKEFKYGNFFRAYRMYMDAADRYEAWLNSSALSRTPIEYDGHQAKIGDYHASELNAAMYYAFRGDISGELYQKLADYYANAALSASNMVFANGNIDHEAAKMEMFALKRYIAALERHNAERVQAVRPGNCSLPVDPIAPTLVHYLEQLEELTRNRMLVDAGWFHEKRSYIYNAMRDRGDVK